MAKPELLENTIKCKIYGNDCSLSFYGVDACAGLMIALHNIIDIEDYSFCLKSSCKWFEECKRKDLIESDVIRKQVSVIYNPKNESIDDIPIIFGFNNGESSQNCFTGVIVAEDGIILGTHICSNESFMLEDLGILENTSPDRHEDFKKHYPDGYKMEFVPTHKRKSHIKLNKALNLNKGMM